MTKRLAKRAVTKTRSKRVRTNDENQDPVLASLAHKILRDCQERSLISRSSLLEADLAAEDSKLETLRASHVELVEFAKKCDVAFLAEEVTVSAAKQSLADATASMTASSSLLRRRQVAQRESQAELAHIAAHKLTLESAVKELCFAPVTLGSDGLPEGMSLSLEVRDDSWLRGFPESGPHAAALQKPFIMQLDKTIASEIVVLGAAIEAQNLVTGECNAAVEAAELEYESRKAVQTKAAADLELAQKDASDREAALGKAREAVAECELQMELVKASLGKARMNLQAFQDGPLAQFLAAGNCVLSTNTVCVKAAGA